MGLPASESKNTLGKWFALSEWTRQIALRNELPRVVPRFLIEGHTPGGKYIVIYVRSSTLE